MDDEIAMTQDCIEWNDNETQVDLRNPINNTSAHGRHAKEESPDREIEDIWKLLERDLPANQPQSNLQRSHSYPMPRTNRRHRLRNKRPRVPGDRKRRRPSSADASKQPDLQTEEPLDDTAVGFEELLKQLNTPGKIENRLSPPDSPTVSPIPQPAEIPIVHTRTSSLPLQPQIENSVVPPLSRQLNKVSYEVSAPLSRPNTVTPTARVAAACQPLPIQTKKNQPAPTIKTSLPITTHATTRLRIPAVSNLAMRQSNQTKTTPPVVPNKAQTVTPAIHATNISEFDDDFDFSEADLAALDAVAASSQASSQSQATTQPNVLPKYHPQKPLTEKTKQPMISKVVKSPYGRATVVQSNIPKAVIVPPVKQPNAAQIKSKVVQYGQATRVGQSSVPNAMIVPPAKQPHAVQMTSKVVRSPYGQATTVQRAAQVSVPKAITVPPAKLIPNNQHTAAKSNTDDEFGDFDFDFGDLDEQIEQRIKRSTTGSPPRKRSRESFGDPFDKKFDFGELDKTIGSRESLPRGILKPTQHQQQQPEFRATMATLLIPPSNISVCNKRVATFDPNRTFVAFSRYQVVAVQDDIASYTKAVLVKSWTSDMNGDDMNKSVLHRPASSRKALPDVQIRELSGESWIFLRGEWYHTPVGPKDAIHLCSFSGRYETNLDALPVILHTNPPSGSNQDDDLILVLHPDTLVPPTIVGETVSCSRRAVLRSRLGSTGISSKAALYGTMRHLLFEKCMTHQDFSIGFAKEAVVAIVRQTAENLVALGIKEAEAIREVIGVLPQLQQFRLKYIDTGMDNRTLDRAYKMEGNGINPDLNIITRSVEGTEESLVSPEFGLKGNIDVTIKAATQDVPSHFVTNAAGPETSMVGIELKTGYNQNPQNAHMAQLALYTLMLSVRYGGSSKHGEHASKTGMLLYINKEGMRAIRVSPVVQELKSLVGQRNVVASEMKRVAAPRGVQIVYEEKEGEDLKANVVIGPAPSAALPQVLSAAQPCNRCYGNRECMLYAKADLETKPIGEVQAIQSSHGKLLDHFTGNLKAEELRYFLDWDRLIDLEADATAKSISQTWLTPSLELERSTGRTVSSLVLEDGWASPSHDVDGSEWVPVTLRRSSDSVSKTEFSRLSIEPRCLVVISADSTSLASTSEEQRKRGTKVKRAVLNIARGVVLSVDDETIIVKVTRQEKRQISREHDTAKVQRRSLMLRLDRDDVQTGLGTTRQNLINLFTGDVKPFENSHADPKLSQNKFVRNRYEWLRNAVVRLLPPKYDSRKNVCILDKTNGVKIPGCDIKILQQEFDELNGDQKGAVERVCSADDYTLIQGLPGTGKSSTIAFVARLLAAHGKRVLITSYTHGAVDNLMIKLIEKGVSATVKTNRNPRMIRVGRQGVSHPTVEPILLTEVASRLQQVVDKSDQKITLPSSNALQAVLRNARIVGVTALSIPRSPVLVGQSFDVVIVDEAGQISQPAILGALMAADTFVLVGDHKQLPPLVTSETAEKAGFGISMLNRLAEKHPDCIAQLTLQYRMHEDICQICNDIVYEGRLKCANEGVRSRTLQLRSFRQVGWISKIINPRRPVVFANTDFFQRDISQSIPKQLVELERQPEKRGQGNIVNDHELLVVKRIIQELTECGLPVSSIGVISPFRAQVRHFNESASMENWKTEGLEISTIDRYQGRDKQVIIISFVRSNMNGFSGRLLNDFRRLNVAVSRAMQKLIMVGSYSTLHKGSKVLQPVLDGITERKQIENIPEFALRAPMSL